MACLIHPAKLAIADKYYKAMADVSDGHKGIPDTVEDFGTVRKGEIIEQLIDGMHDKCT